MRPPAIRKINRRIQQIRTAQAQPAPQPSYMTPYSAQADTSIAGLQQNYGDSMANSAYQEQQAKQAYGLEPGYNDPLTNPYSKAALLEQSYNNAQRSNTNNYAARGQLYSGSLTNAQNTASGGYLQNRAGLQQQQQDTLYGINQQRLAAQRALEQGSAQASAGALSDALQTPIQPAAVTPNYAAQINRLQKRRQQIRKR